MLGASDAFVEYRGNNQKILECECQSINFRLLQEEDGEIAIQCARCTEEEAMDAGLGCHKFKFKEV
jgi:hypothetical protein